MTFYTFKFIQRNQTQSKTILHLLILLAAVVAVIFAVLYLRNRLDTRYRDLVIIAVLFLLMFVGTRYEHYMQTSTQKSQSAQIMPFIESVAKDHQVDKKDVLVSSTTLQDGIIVRIDSKNKDYRLSLNDDNNSYTLKQAHVIDHRVIIKK